MARKIAYWVSTSIVCVLSLFAAYAYLSGNPQAIQGFAGVGYPQQLRVILGIAKPLGAIVLLIPGFLRLKEWAYAGFTFAWISASIAHHLARISHQWWVESGWWERSRRFSVLATCSGVGTWTEMDGEPRSAARKLFWGGLGLRDPKA